MSNKGSKWMNRQQVGFTLMEMIITMTILSIISIVGVELTSTGYRAYFLSKDLSSQVSHSLVTLQRMAYEIQAAHCADPAKLPSLAAGATAATLTTTSTATTTTNTMNDTVADSTVMFSQTGTSIMLTKTTTTTITDATTGVATVTTVTVGPSPLADNIQANSLSFFLGVGDNTGAVDPPCLVTVNFTVSAPMTYSKDTILMPYRTKFVLGNY